MHELLGKSARDVVSLLKNREVNPYELIDLVEERVAEVGETVNALPILCFDRARARADKLPSPDSKQNQAGYLYGLPVAIKDLRDVEGVITTKGSVIYKDNVAQSSDISVQTLERNGALIVAKSNVPEFGAGGNTYNDVFGPTRNPWNLKKSAGGSSGGAAAALTTGQIWLATGSDLFGSIRIPSSFCSTVGLRPSPGRVACGPDSTAFHTLAVEGPMARSVGDVALMLDAQVGFNAGDPRSLPSPDKPFVEAVDNPIPLRRVAFSKNLNLGPVHHDVGKLFDRAVSVFGNICDEVIEDCPDFADVEEHCTILRAELMVTKNAELLEKERDRLKEKVVWNIEQGLRLTAGEIGRASRWRSDLYWRVSQFFEKYDVLITPAVLVPPFDITDDFVKKLGDYEFGTYFAWSYFSYAITMTGCPALSVPCGFTADGLPVGLQIVGPPRGEAAVLSAGALFEAEMRSDILPVPIDPKRP